MNVSIILVSHVRSINAVFKYIQEAIWQEYIHSFDVRDLKSWVHVV